MTSFRQLSGNDQAELRRRVRRIVTESRKPDEPKDPDQYNRFDLCRHFATPGDVERVRVRYYRGGLSHNVMKEVLSAAKARVTAQANLEKVRRAVCVVASSLKGSK